MNQRHFYDWLSQYYKFVGLFDDYYKRKALELFKLKQSTRFLDIGCGTGFVLKQLKDHATVFGIDSSYEMAARAQRRSSTYLSCGDCFYLPFHDSSFDILFSSFVFDIFDSSEQKKILSEFSRVLTPSGLLILVNNTRGKGVFSWLSGFYLILTRIFPTVLLNKPIDTSSIISKSGFTIKKKHVIGFTEILVCKMC